MSGTRSRWMQKWLVTTLAVTLAGAAPVAAVQAGSISTVPVGASGSTVYMSVTNTSLQPVSATMNLALTSGLTTIVGSASVTLAPLATVAVPVPMSGPVSTSSKLSLSSSLKVSVIDTQDPFCQ